MFFLAAVGLAVLVIESLQAPAAPLAPAPGDADVIDLRLGRVPPPAPVLLEPAPVLPGTPPGRPAPGPGAPPGAGGTPPDGEPGGVTPRPPSRDDPSDYYVVQPGDTLSTIAQKQLGSAAKADELMRLNKLADADAIVVGQVLRLR